VIFLQLVQIICGLSKAIVAILVRLPEFLYQPKVGDCHESNTGRSRRSAGYHGGRIGKRSGHCATASFQRAAPAAATPPVVPAYNWTSFYIGGNLGGGWARADFANTATGTADGVPLPTNTNSGTATARGLIGGGQIGFNYEFPANWLLGIEADIDAANITGSASGCVATAAGVVGSCATNSIRFQDFGTVRGRFGYALNNVLLYGTGGWAYGERNTTSTVTCAGPGCPVGSSLPFVFNSPSATTFLSGWTAGAGLEWGFLRNWTLRIEYLHLQFNGVGENFGFTGTVTGVPIVSNVHNTTNNGIDIARVGVSYLFNWGPRY